MGIRTKDIHVRAPELLPVIEAITTELGAGRVERPKQSVVVRDLVERGIKSYLPELSAAARRRICEAAPVAKRLIDGAARG